MIKHYAPNPKVREDEKVKAYCGLWVSRLTAWVFNEGITCKNCIRAINKEKKL